MKTLVHAINSCHWEWLHEKFHSNKPAPKHDNKSQQKSKKKPRLLPVTPPSRILPLLPAVATTRWPNCLPPEPLFLISWVKMVSFWLRNIKDISTAIFVYTVVVLATRLLTARRQLPPLPRLNPAWLQSRERKEGTKKRLSSPLASAQPEDCIIPSCATMEAVCLNTSPLSDPNSLHVLLTSTSISIPLLPH